MFSPEIYRLLNISRLDLFSANQVISLANTGFEAILSLKNLKVPITSNMSASLSSPKK